MRISQSVFTFKNLYWYQIVGNQLTFSIKFLILVKRVLPSSLSSIEEIFAVVTLS